MSVEEIRGCGYRKVGGLYLVGDFVPHICDRLPMELHQCPFCGQGITFNRGVVRLRAREYFGLHMPCSCGACNVCSPPEGTSFIVWVGKGHYKTPREFLTEAIRLGVSRRIPAIPKGLELGRSVVYLAHSEAVAADQPAQTQADFMGNGEFLDYQPRMFETDQKPDIRPGIFAAFVPLRIEKLFWERHLTDTIKRNCTERGITPVVIPNGDPDHSPETRL